MIVYYNLKLRINNGYRCSCCYRNWWNESNISINIDKDEKFFHKKSNHKIIFPELSEIIFEEGCRTIKRVYGDDEFSKEFRLKYNFYSEELESSVEFEFDEDNFTEYNLQNRWEEFEKQLEVKIEADKKAKRIKSFIIL